MLDQENEEKIYMVHYHILTEELMILYINTYLHNAHLILGIIKKVCYISFFLTEPYVV